MTFRFFNWWISDTIHTWLTWLALATIGGYFNNIQDKQIILFVTILALPWTFITFIDTLLQENYPTNWFIKHLAWYGKLHIDEECWKEGYNLTWK